MIGKRTNNGKINMYLQLSNKIQLILNETNRAKEYFMVEMLGKATMSKTLSKCIAIFDYFD